MGARVEAPAAAGVLLPFTVGYLAGGVHRAGAPGTVLAVAVAVMAVVVSRPRTARLTCAAGAAGLALGALGAVLAQLPTPSTHVARLVGFPVTAVEGTIAQSERNGTRVSLIIRVEQVRSRRRTGTATGLLGVTVAHAVRDWRVGSGVRIVGRLRQPHTFANPGAYDHAGALRRRGIRATIFLWDETSIMPLGTVPAGIPGVVDRLRANLATRIAQRADEPVRGYLTAVLLGATQSLDAETRTALTRTGLAHVVSVSGFHVAIAAGASVVALRWLMLRMGALALRVDVTAAAATLGVVPVAAYAAVAGGSIPATRAFLTYAVVLTALLAGRPPDAIRALACVALLVASRTPDVAADVSFELSFASVLALLLVARHARRGRRDPARLPFGPRWWRQLVIAPLATSLAASLATAPLTAWHFQQVSLIGPVANLAALPLLGPATLLPGLAALPLCQVLPGLSDALLTLAAAAAGLGLHLAARLAAVPWAAVTTPMPSLLELALCYGGGALAWWRASDPSAAPGGRAFLTITTTVMVLAAGDVGYWLWERLANPTMRVTFLSVGQGDAAVVELPRGGVLVIDAGGFTGDFDPGERLVAPFLRSRKILHLDVLVMSHPQLDHYGGLAYLAEHFTPAELWSNGMRSTSAAFARLEAAVAATGMRSVVLARGMTRRLGDVVVEVVHPGSLDGRSVNDASLVLRVVHRRTAILMTGDIEAPAESDLERSGLVLASTVLKVPHHGSATSSTSPWIAAVAPRIAVVSSGENNRFGFPAPAVVRRLRRAGAAIWNTADDGAVSVVSDGNDVVVRAERRDADGVRFEFPKSLW